MSNAQYQQMMMNNNYDKNLTGEEKELLESCNMFIQALRTQHDLTNFERCFQWLSQILGDPDNIKVMANMSNEILHAILTFMAMFMKEGIDVNVPQEFYKGIFDPLKTLCNNSVFLEKVTENILYYVVNTLLHILLFTDEQKNTIKDQHPEWVEFFEETMKCTNNIILHILEHANPGDLYNVLFELLLKSKTDNVPQKYIGLAVKCILRHTKTLEKIKFTIDPEKIIYKMHCYLVIGNNDKSSDDIGNKTIKTVLNELVKHMGEDRIEECYQVVENDSRPDNHLKRWINVIIQQKNSNLSNNSDNLRKPRVTNDENLNTNSLQSIRDKQRGMYVGEPSELKIIVQKYNMINSEQEYALVTQELYEAITRYPSTNIHELLRDIGDLRKRVMNDLNILHNIANKQNENVAESNQKNAGRGNVPTNQKTNYNDIDDLQSRITNMKNTNRSRGNLEVNDMNAGINNIRSNNNYNSNSYNQTYPPNAQKQEDVFSKLNQMKAKMYNVLNNNQDN